MRKKKKPRPPKKTKRVRLTEAALRQAIIKLDGNYTEIARRFGCERGSVYAFVKRHPALVDVVEQAREGLVDLCETTWKKAVKKGGLGASIFGLETLGRKRGFTRRGDLVPLAEVGAAFVEVTAVMLPLVRPDMTQQATEAIQKVMRDRFSKAALRV